jgi:chromosomal replication initiation ATPase DnaA
MKRITVEILGVPVRILPISGDPPRTGSRKTHLELLLRSVAEANGFSVAEIMKEKRSRVLVQVRKEFARVARAHKYSLIEIGVTLHRHHSTIMHLLK